MTVPRRIGILTTDTELVVTSWDTALVSMTGIGSADATGRPLTEVIPDLEARGLLRVLREPLESGAARCSHRRSTGISSRVRPRRRRRASRACNSAWSSARFATAPASSA